MGRIITPSHNSELQVAFVISAGANLLDLAGAWEVFRNTLVERGEEHWRPFRLFTVCPQPHAIETTGGLFIIPAHTFATAPLPDIVSVGAQNGSPEIHDWLAEQSRRADVTLLSVCTGAFQLARAGILSGRRATTHHDFMERFETEHPDVRLVRGRRYVRDGNVVTAGGLTSGIDAALHVVATIFGRDAAARTAEYLEYDSTGWHTGAQRFTTCGVGTRREDSRRGP